MAVRCGIPEFRGATISSDGGASPLRQTDKLLNLIPRLAESFIEGEMLSQRIYRAAQRQEELNDHEQLSKDPVFGILAGTNTPGSLTRNHELAIVSEKVGEKRTQSIKA